MQQQPPHLNAGPVAAAAQWPAMPSQASGGTALHGLHKVRSDGGRLTGNEYGRARFEHDSACVRVSSGVRHVHV